MRAVFLVVLALLVACGNSAAPVTTSSTTSEPAPVTTDVPVVSTTAVGATPTEPPTTEAPTTTAPEPAFDRRSLVPPDVPTALEVAEVDRLTMTVKSENLRNESLGTTNAVVVFQAEPRAEYIDFEQQLDDRSFAQETLTIDGVTWRRDEGELWTPESPGNRLLFPLEFDAVFRAFFELDATYEETTYNGGQAFRAEIGAEELNAIREREGDSVRYPALVASVTADPTGVIVLYEAVGTAENTRDDGEVVVTEFAVEVAVELGAGDVVEVPPADESVPNALDLIVGLRFGDASFAVDGVLFDTALEDVTLAALNERATDRYSFGEVQAAGMDIIGFGRSDDRYYLVHQSASGTWFCVRSIPVDEDSGVVTYGVGSTLADVDEISECARSQIPEQLRR